MKYLIDTGILLRMTTSVDPHHGQIIAAIRFLKDQGASFHCGFQNIAEFWNVATRPPSARGGFGLSPLQAHRRLVLIEQAIDILAEPPTVYGVWRRLLIDHSVAGVQAHDTRLAALMMVHGLREILTLNPDDFRRFPAIVARTPAEVLADPLAPSTPPPPTDH